MINKLKHLAMVSFAAMVLSIGALPALTHADTRSDIQGGVNTAAGGASTKKPGTTISETLATVLNVLSIVIGIVAVVMVIIGGFKYITSAGDSGKTASAKNTILYAVIGLVIVIFAQIIVNFVINAADGGKGVTGAAGTIQDTSGSSDSGSSGSGGTTGTPIPRAGRCSGAAAVDC